MVVENTYQGKEIPLVRAGAYFSWTGLLSVLKLFRRPSVLGCSNIILAVLFDIDNCKPY